jgi:hypothetical protein
MKHPSASVKPLNHSIKFLDKINCGLSDDTADPLIITNSGSRWFSINPVNLEVLDSILLYRLILEKFLF